MSSNELNITMHSIDATSLLKTTTTSGSEPPQPPHLPINTPAPVFAIRKATELSECKWASNYPEIQKACYLARVCSMISPKSCRLKKIQPQLQEGPTCGLAALSMLLGGHPTVDKLLQIARHKKYTRNGEMFSASNLFNLIENVLLKDQSCGHGANYTSSDGDVDTTTVNNCYRIDVQCLSLFNGKLNCDTIKQVLLNGGCLLVPYPFHDAKNIIILN